MGLSEPCDEDNYNFCDFLFELKKKKSNICEVQ